MGLVESADGGDRLATLQELRGVLAVSITQCESMRDIAALAGRLQAVLSEIEELSPKESVGDGIDEIAKRRSDRRPGTAAAKGRAKRPS